MEYSALNSQLSASRNMYLTSSVAVAMIGFSNSFEGKFANRMKIIGLCMILYSICIGLVTWYTFSRYIKEMSKGDKRYQEWYVWNMLTIVYVVILCFVSYIFLTRKIFK